MLKDAILFSVAGYCARVEPRVSLRLRTVKENFTLTTLLAAWNH
jgi:hypothetical protein